MRNKNKMIYVGIGILAVLAVVVFFVFFKTDAKRFRGSFTLQCELIELMPELAEEDTNGMIPADYFGDVAMQWLYTFNKDGTYTVVVDTDSLQRAKEEIRYIYEEYYYDLSKVILEREGFDEAYFLEMTGMPSLRDYANTRARNEDLTVFNRVLDNTFSGRYEVKKGKLYINRNSSEAPDRTHYYKCKFGKTYIDLTEDENGPLENSIRIFRKK